MTKKKKTEADELDPRAPDRGIRAYRTEMRERLTVEKKKKGDDRNDATIAGLETKLERLDKQIVD